MGRVTTSNTQVGPGREIHPASNGDLHGGQLIATTTETDDVMPASPAPSPAYTATVRPLPLHHPSLRQVRLSGRQADALAGLTVPIGIDGASGVLPCAQAETALKDAANAALGDREVCAVLYRWSRGGELWVLCGRSFVRVATVELTPARIAVAA